MHVGGEPAFTTDETVIEVKTSFERLRRDDTKEGMLSEMSGKMLKKPGTEAFLYATARLRVRWTWAMMSLNVVRSM